MCDGVVVVWLIIDNDDNNEVWFLLYLFELIWWVWFMLVELLGYVFEEYGDDVGCYVLILLIDEIYENDDWIVVVIDDWYWVFDNCI